MGAQRQLWIRILAVLFITGMGLLGLSAWLDRSAEAGARADRHLRVEPLPALHDLGPSPGSSSGTPYRDPSMARVLELALVRPGAETRDLGCLLDLTPEGLFLRHRAEAPQRIYLRGPPLVDWSGVQRAQLLSALEGLLTGWGRDPSELRWPPGEGWRTLGLWIHGSGIPMARR